MKIDTEIRSKYKIKQNIREQIKEHIQERMEKHIESFQKKNKTKTNNINVTDQDNFNKLMDPVFNNKTKFETEIYELPSKYTSPKTCAEVGLPREVTLTLSYGVSRI